MQSRESRKTRILFRQTVSNRFTLPVLLAALERSGITRDITPGIVNNRPELERALRDHTPALIAYGFMTPHTAEVWEEVRRVKQAGSGRTVWVAGGPHPTGDPESAFRMGFDVVAAGEGEEIFPRLCGDFLEKGAAVTGQIYKPETPFPLDESRPISPLADLVPPLEITRGCFYRCRFCQTGSEKPRHRSPASVREYMEMLKTRDLLFRAGFICPSGFEYGAERPGDVRPERIEMLLRTAKEAGIRHLEYGVFPTEIRPETVTPEMLVVIKKWCSNRKITLGGQTGSEPLIRRIRRGHTRDRIDRAAAYIHEAGFKPQIDIILGFPDETPEDRRETLDWMKRLGRRFPVRIHVHYFLPLAGTDYADADPRPLEPEIKKRLEAYHKAGICNDWWKRGEMMSRKIVQTRAALRSPCNPSFGMTGSVKENKIL
ncbi:MAG TPA: TIGR04013 family B12-binding domain/radical SAM domain-containing protein [bacterium]|nr:TIGR04013 family B12-binding domain/radical SAM domain-containing protein [bacterium]